MSSDTIANMLSTIKNASMVNKEFVEVSHSKEREAVAKVLKESGFLEEVKVFKPEGKPYKGLHLGLSYDSSGIPAIKDLRRLSRPGRRMYRKSSELRPVKNGYGLLVVSTSRGVMSGEQARKKRLGGEVVCEVW
jgi:small subunit ribosomal protein S8